MRSVYLTPTGFRFRDVEMPSCQSNEVLVKTTSCGICEGDVFAYKTRSSLDAPILLGHEGSGVVTQVGCDVRNYKPGDHVTALGGAYADYFTVKESDLIHLPEQLDLRTNPGEPIACFVHAANRFGIQKGDRVAVIGCGYMGIGCLEMANVYGAGEIVAIEPLAWRRQTATNTGATSVCDPTNKSANDLLRELGEFDVIIEATGVSSVIDVATKLIKQHGKIILVGYHQSDNGIRHIDMKTWNFKAIDVINGHVRRNDEKLVAMQQGIGLILDGKLNFDNLVKQYKIEEINDAFNDLISRKEGLFKAMLCFN